MWPPITRSSPGHSCHHNQPVLHSRGEAFQEWVFYQTTCLGAGSVLLLCLWQRCPNSFSKCVPCSGVTSTAGVHPSEEGAACPCSWARSAVPTTARHLLGENVLQQTNPPALEKGSRGDGTCSLTSLLLTPPGRLVHGQETFLLDHGFLYWNFSHSAESQKALRAWGNQGMGILCTVNTISGF